MKENNTENLKNIWEQMHNKLFQFIYKRVPQKADAEDLLQEVFLKIHNSIDSLRNISKLESWIFQITRNAINDYYRTKKNFSELPEEPHVKEEGKDAVIELSSSINGFVEQLSPEYRQAITFVELEGNQQNELAEKLGISLSGAKSRVQRGRKILKEMLLDCCHFEFDSMGKMTDYHKRSDCCRRFKSNKDAHLKDGCSKETSSKEACSKKSCASS